MALAQRCGLATLRVDRLAMRSYLRSRDVRKVLLAVDHLVANVAAKSAAVDALCRGAVGVDVAVEWADWVERDRETADRMGNYVFAVLQQGGSRGSRAGTELRALIAMERAVEFDQ